MKTKRKSSTIAITLEQLDAPEALVAAVKSSILFFIREGSAISKPFSRDWSTKINFEFDKENLLKSAKKLVPLTILAVILIWTLFQAGSFLQKALSKNAAPTDNRVQISGPLETRTLNKELEIPIKDNSGKVVTSIKYDLQSAELRNEIIVQGQKMVAVKGRTFLIFNIKLTNDYDKQIDVNARDNIRLVFPGSDEKIAADIHNDPVSVQPTSTKLTRLGFPINDTSKSLTIFLGLVDGPKQSISLKF